MSRVRGWDLIYWVLTVGEWHGPDCSLSWGLNFLKFFGGKRYRVYLRGPKSPYISGDGVAVMGSVFGWVCGLCNPASSPAAAAIAANVLPINRDI